MQKKLSIKILFLLLSTIITLLSLEIIARQRGMMSTEIYTYEKDYGLPILKPGLKEQIQGKCFNTYLNVNSEGFNDSEFIVEKDNDVYRIAVLGSWAGEGRQVPPDKNFQYLLEKKLNEMGIKDKKFEVYSFGIWQNGLLKDFFYLKKYVLKYNPDLVIFAYLPINHFRGEDINYLAKEFDENGKIKEGFYFKEKILSHSVLALWMDYKFQVAKINILNKFRNALVPKESLSSLPFDFQIFLKNYPKGWQKLWDYEKEMLREARDITENNNSRFIIVSLTDLWSIYPQTLPQDKSYSAELKELDFDKPEKIIEEFAVSESIPYLNLIPTFKEKVSQEKKLAFFWPCDFHWNENGHLWASEGILDFLTKNKLIGN